MRLNTDPIPIFHEKTVPQKARLAGWSALVRALGVQAPVRSEKGFWVSAPGCHGAVCTQRPNGGGK